MVNPEETARLHRAVATLRKPKHSLHSNTSLSPTASSILHPSLSTAIQLTRRTDRINGRKILNLNFVFFGIHDPEIKKDGLIIYGGRDIADLETLYQMSKPQTHPRTTTRSSSESWTNTFSQRKT